MPLAEGPSIDGGTLAVILAVLVVMFVTWLAAVVLGFRWAARAARGDRASAWLWGGAASVVLLPGISAARTPVLLVSLAVVVAQALVFASARRS